MIGFAATDGAGYVARLDAPERAVLLDVVDAVIELLADGDDPGDAQGAPPSLEHPPRRTPQDPALLRLLPDASWDRELAGELRRLTEADLRSAKTGQLRRLRAVLDAARPDAVVVPSEAMAVAAALTDTRLVLASRLGVVDDDDAQAVYELAVREDRVVPGAQGERRFLAAVYTVLTELQDSLVQLMVEALPPVDGGPV